MEIATNRLYTNYMRHTILFFLTVLLLFSCATTGQMSSDNEIFFRDYGIDNEPTITQSLFADNNSTISEENIQRILEGTFRLPDNLRVAVVKLESKQIGRMYGWWTNEEYLKTQQAYLDLITEKLKSSPRVEKVSVIPDILISNNPTFVTIRESAVRTQANIVAIYSINSEIYTRSRAFTRADIKAFATTQLILLDVKTGLIPFSATITKDYQSRRNETELDDSEARNRIKNEAVLLTLNEIGMQLIDFLDKENQ